jgi:hypothetical protein
MISFKEYRLNEAGGVPSMKPRNATSQDGLAALEAEVLGIVDTSITTLQKSLRQRGGEMNPFDVMRQNLPWYRRLGNWWNRFWNNDTSNESQEYGLEFPDFIPLHEQEAFHELELIMEGPINHAIDQMMYRLQSLREELHKAIKQSFATYRQSQSQPGGTQATLQPATTSDLPAKSNKVMDAKTQTFDPEDTDDSGSTSPLPDPADSGPDATTPDVGSPPETPESPDATPPGTPPSRLRDDIHIENVAALTGRGDYGLASKVAFGGKIYKVASAKYNKAGELVSVEVKGIKGEIPVPEELGKKVAIRYGRREGTIEDIRKSIINGDPPISDEPSGTSSEPTPTPTPPTPPPVDRKPPEEPPVDDEIDTSPIEDPESAEEGEHDVSWLPDKDQRLYDKAMAARAEREAMGKLTPADRFEQSLKNNPDYLNPTLLKIIDSSPTPEYRHSIVSFLAGMSKGTRISLFPRNNHGFMDTDVDLGKLDWIAELSPEKAYEVGEKIEDMDEDNPGFDLKKELEPYFANKETFDAWVNSPNESTHSRTKIFVENLKNKPPKTDKENKEIPFDKQVTRYKKKLRSRAKS